jgi:hypothetical protein
MRAPFKMTLIWLLTVFTVGEFSVRISSTDQSNGSLDFGFREREGLNELGGKLIISPTLQRRFRPQRMLLEPPPGARRIFVYGDSVARGSAATEPYSSVIERALSATGIPSETLNFAAVGAGARKQQSVMKGTLRYRPDIVVLHLNTHNEAFDERDWAERDRFLHWHPRYWLAHSKMFRLAGEWKRHKLYERWLPGMAGPLLQGNDKFILWEPPDPEVYRRRRALVMTVTGRNIELARKAGARVVLVSPVRVTKRHDRFEFDDEGLDQFCASLESTEVRFLSMTQLFRGESPFESHLRGDGVHLDRDGHSRLGLEIARKLQEWGWLKPDPQADSKPDSK